MILAFLILITAINAEDSFNYYNVPGCLGLFSRNINFVTLNNGEIIPLTSSKSSSSGSACSNATTTLNLAYSNIGQGFASASFNLVFLNSIDYWILSSSKVSITCSQTQNSNCTQVTNASLIAPWMTAPNEFNYKCVSPPLAIINQTNLGIQFVSLQLEPFGFNSSFSNNVDDCVGFFSIGILTNLFVTSVLIAILSYGLHMVMNIQNNDHYDDPKQKPIQLGTNE